MNSVVSILILFVALSIGISSLIMAIDTVKRWIEKKRDSNQQAEILNNILSLKQLVEDYKRNSSLSDDRSVAKQESIPTISEQNTNPKISINTNGSSLKEEIMKDTCSPTESIRTNG